MMMIRSVVVSMGTSWARPTHSHVGIPALTESTCKLDYRSRNSRDVQDCSHCTITCAQCHDAKGGQSYADSTPASGSCSWSPPDTPKSEDFLFIGISGRPPRHALTARERSTERRNCCDATGGGAVDGIVRNKRTVEAFNCTNGQPREIFMADNSGGIGVMGVLVGALIVIVVGGGFFMRLARLAQSQRRH